MDSLLGLANTQSTKKKTRTSLKYFYKTFESYSTLDRITYTMWIECVHNKGETVNGM